MDWLQSNWFWVLILIFFIGMHLFGHGGHGGCGGGHRHEPESEKKPEKPDDAHRHHH